MSFLTNMVNFTGMKLICIALPCYILSFGAFAQEGNNPPEYIQINYKASPRPDRILLTWDDDAHTTQTVTWRTDTSIKKPMAELALSMPSPGFSEQVTRIKPTTDSSLDSSDGVLYHSARFEALLPNSTYLYRVGDGRYWSEWISFRTAEQEDAPFSFIYMGDAQNKLFFHWSRMVRAAYAKRSDARFILHAGDLINNAGNEYEWGEWFEAAHFINRSMPVIATPGNHEYYKDESGHKTGLSNYWKPQFNYPKNGLPTLENTNYFIDYKYCRIISMNSNEQLDKQVSWLDSVLKHNPQTWTIVTFHHPVLAASKERANEGVYTQWKPLFDKYRVDLVLQGHDHAYARGSNLNVGKNRDNPESGTVYIISVAGPKMYDLTVQDWMQCAANNTQLYQIIDVSKEQITYTSYTPEGKSYDAFSIKKVPGQINRLEELPVELEPRK